MAESLGVYVPAKVLGKALALGRMLMFVYLLDRLEYGLWSIGMMLAMFAAPLVGLSCHQGIIRYVSGQEAAGKIGEFYRRLRLPLLAIILISTGLAMAGSGVITDLVITAKPEVSAGVQRPVLLGICWAAIANAALLAGLWNVLAIFYGLRMYIAAAGLELLFAVGFFAVGGVALTRPGSAILLMWLHAAMVAALLLTSLALLPSALARAKVAALAENHSSQAKPKPKHPMGAVIRFSLAGMAGMLAWMAAGYFGLWKTNRDFGPSLAAVFAVFFILAQSIAFLAEATWAVVLPHATRLWETAGPGEAKQLLASSYKTIAAALMTLAVAVYLSQSLWKQLLPEKYDIAQSTMLLAGLMTIFQVTSHMGLLMMLAKLRQQPVFHALAALAGLACGAAFTIFLLKNPSPPAIAFWLGAGIYLGSGAVATAYFTIIKPAMPAGCYILLAAPAILLLPPPVAALAWAGFLAVAATTRIIFTKAEKQQIINRMRSLRPFGPDSKGT